MKNLLAAVLLLGVVCSGCSSPEKPKQETKEPEKQAMKTEDIFDYDAFGDEHFEALKKLNEEAPKPDMALITGTTWKLTRTLALGGINEQMEGILNQTIAEDIGKKLRLSEDKTVVEIRSAESKGTWELEPTDSLKISMEYNTAGDKYRILLVNEKELVLTSTFLGDNEYYYFTRE